MEQDDYTVYISLNRFALTEEHLAQLQATVNPLADSDNFGIELYHETHFYVL